MGFVASVETDVGDYLRVLHPDGQLGGKPLLSFLTALGDLCSARGDTDPDLRTWFMRLEAHLQAPICMAIAPLLNAHYDGEWDYRADEYPLFRQRSPHMPLTEAEFQQILNQIALRWGEIEQVQSAATLLFEVLTAVQPEATWWFDPDWTIRDLEALSQTLTLAGERQARLVRIQFI
jgi:hypothetical protein